MELTERHLEIMRAAEMQPGWRPAWRGALTLCRQMARNGLMKECGSSAMPPHVVFCLTTKGETELRRISYE